MRPLLLLLLLTLPLACPAEIPITSAPLSELLMKPARSAPATVESRNDVELASQITARVAAFPVRVGDPVEPSQVLLELDCRAHESELAAARAGKRRLRAQHRLAAQQLTRSQKLKTASSISDEEVERRDAELADLAAQLEAQDESIRQAELRVEYCRIRAPFTGVVMERLSDLGALASPGTPLVRLVQTDQLEVSAELTEPEARELALAEDLSFELAGERYPLRLRRLPPVVDPRTRTRQARLEFTGPSAPAGSAGRLRWEAESAFLPPELLVRRDGSLGVFLVEDGKARFHPLPDATEGQPARVDLPAAARLVLEGRQRLSDGDAVVPALD